MTTINNQENFHNLQNKWALWAHFPHNTDWSIKSYIKIATFEFVEDVIAATESLTSKMVENCMLFLMKDGISPTWEDPMNRKGGFFSYKVMNKFVYNSWKDLTYLITGATISKNIEFQNSVTGITISPKKNFCIVKIWMSNCLWQNPELVSPEIKEINNNGCIFKKHVPEY